MRLALGESTRVVQRCSSWHATRTAIRCRPLRTRKAPGFSVGCAASSAVVEKLRAQSLQLDEFDADAVTEVPDQYPTAFTFNVCIFN